MAVKRLGIFYHPLKEAAHALARELEGFLGSQGISIWLCSAWEGEQAKTHLKDTDLVLSIGGDGTILRTAQAVMPSPIPITGINLGKLGFLTELTTAEVKEKLPPLLAGEGWLDERAMLETELYAEDSKPVGPFYALNDVVMARGAIARTIQVEVSIGEELLTNYRSDGVIVATATGSTGYSLAAGGPVLYPQMKELVLLPIVPHLCLAYPLVLPASAAVSLHLSTLHQATLSIDGHINLPISSGATVKIKSSTKKTRFLRIHPKASFYSSLERKLKGKQ